MGIFGWRGGVRTDSTPRRSPCLDPGQLAWLPGRIEVQVAGESFHEDAIDAVDESSSRGSPLAAVLVPEPGNAHDSHAVAVYVGGEHVGFLPRVVAQQVQPALLMFGQAHSGRLVSCPAEIRRHDLGPQVVLLLDPGPLGLRAEAFQIVPELDAAIGRLLARLDEPAPLPTGADMQARAALSEAERLRAETDADYDRKPDDWPRVEKAFVTLAYRLAHAGDPYASIAWLGAGRSTRYQRGRGDDTLAALIEALHWWRGNADAWRELLDLAAAAPHEPTLVALFARIPFEVRPAVLGRLLSLSHGRDRLGNMSPAAGTHLRARLLEVAESQRDAGAVATLAGEAGLAAEKAGDLDEAAGWWRRAVAAGSTDEKVADRYSVWLVKQHEYGEAARVLRQALATTPHSAEAAERMRRRLSRCERNLMG